jgi:hypothetical protein
MEAVYPLGLFAFVLGHGEPIVRCDALQHQHAVAVEDLADRFNVVSLGLNFDLTRLQRARERTGQSTTGGGNHVIEGRRARWEVACPAAVMLGDLRMNPEHDRLLLRGQVRETLRATEALDPDSRNVCWVGHRAGGWRAGTRRVANSRDL